MKKVVEIDNITKSYEKKLKIFFSTLIGKTDAHSDENTVLHKINLSFFKSEIIGIVGKNGAGKSTLLKLISGILKPTTGTVKITGRIASLLELGSGFNHNFTGRENVHLYSKVLGFSDTKIKDEIDDIIEFSGLEDHIDRPLRTYSSGMIARLAFTVATKVNPDILIIDEALSVGDGEFKQKSFSKILELKDKGVTIIFCSHSLYQIELLCTRVLWLDKGRTIFLGEPQEAISKYRDFISNKPLTDKKPREVIKNDSAGYITQISVYKNASPYQDSDHFISEKDSLRIKVCFLIKDETQGTSVAISFSLIDGPIICGIGSFEKSVEPIIQEGKGSISLLIKKLNLLKGTYSININLMNRDGTVCFDAVRDSLRIKIRQESLKQGYVVIDDDWLI